MKNLIRITFASLLLVVFISPHIFAKDEPTIDDRSIHFNTGKVLTYTKISKNESGSTMQTPTLITEWHRLLLTTEQQMYEDSQSNLEIYDYSGKLINKTPSFIGECIFLKEKKRILLGQSSAHFDVRKSYLLDKNGETIKIIIQAPNVYKFEVSEDQNILWILSRSVKDMRPITIAMAIDSNGNTIKTLTIDKAGSLQLNYRQKNYSIKIEAPQLPG